MNSPTRGNEILDIYENNRQTQNEKRRKDEWRRHLQRSIRQSFPHLRLVLAGSSGCGFAVNGSDCDFTLVKQTSSHEYGVSVLRQIKAIVELEGRSLGTEVNWESVIYYNSKLLLSFRIFHSFWLRSPFTDTGHAVLVFC